MTLSYESIFSALQSEMDGILDGAFAMRHTKNYTYFTSDGSYGDSMGMCVIDTSGWSSADWDKIEEASDSERAGVAHQIYLDKRLKELEEK